ncbi:vWA domain-containing protein [Sorangium sp. So ce119]|uniref:vWA domain-containing protein n=1 Tax=Sorangium sp. So ce119 TaxID=3133279 RepID=UPI003F62DD86
MRLLTMTIALSMVALAGAACGGASNSSDGGGSSGGGSSQSGGSPTGSASTGDFGVGAGAGPGGNSGSGSGAVGSTGAGQACAAQSAQTGLQQVYLAFAFDVSGSMGANNEEWHDKALKWDPVVAATKQFFSDPGSTGLMASLTFFPGPDRRRMCRAGTYESPDVPMTSLPSQAFGEAIDDVTPRRDDDWRMGTPTAFVVEGTVGFIEEERQQSPGKYAVVLVTDGYPQLCEGSDSIEAVVRHVRAARENGIATYVVGVANPPVPDAPENVENLQDIAEAGGTGEAFIIDTGDPAQTTATFKAAIDQIRGTAISCTIAIPSAPDGRTFDKQKVNVTYTSGTGNTPTNLLYDQDCAVESAWRYDDPANPTSIELCASACATVQADPAASLSVEFTCEDVIEVPL